MVGDEKVADVGSRESESVSARQKCMGVPMCMAKKCMDVWLNL